MLLFLLDALSAIGEGEALLFLFKLFFVGLLPVVLLLAYWWHRLGKQFDREPQASRPRARPPITNAGSGKGYLLALGLAMCFAAGIVAMVLTNKG
jgi:hypothetical protein